MVEGSDRTSCARTVAASAVALTLALVLALAFARSRRAARGVPLSPLTAGRRVGPAFVERRGVGTRELGGEMDDMAEFARGGFDPDAVHPTVRAFYERTADFEMRYRVRWHRGFRLGAALAARLTTRLGQLNLPGPGGERRWRRLDSRILGLDPGADPREGARAWVRTKPDTGEAVFVAMYGHHAVDGTGADAPSHTDDAGERYVNIAVPLPATNLSTVLRLEHLDDAPASGGVRLTTRAPADPGLYLATSAGAFALPMDQTFRVWPDPDGDDASRLRATHEMWAFGRQFLTVEYEIVRRDGDDGGGTDGEGDGRGTSRRE